MASAPRMTDGRSKILCRPAIEHGRPMNRANVRQLRTGRYCALCWGLPWRVTGRWCLHCGLPYREEESVGLGECVRSNAGEAVSLAQGNTGLARKGCC